MKHAVYEVANTASVVTATSDSNQHAVSTPDGSYARPNIVIINANQQYRIVSKPLSIDDADVQDDSSSDADEAVSQAIYGNILNK